jgi:hypothetical protein
VRRIFIWTEKPTAFDFTQLKTLGWEVEMGKPPYDVWIFNVFIGNGITGKKELWDDLSREFRGLLIYHWDGRGQLTGDIVSNMQRADMVTVPDAHSKALVAMETTRSLSEVRIVPEDELEQLAFWNTIQKAAPW